MWQLIEMCCVTDEVCYVTSDWDVLCYRWGVLCDSWLRCVVWQLIEMCCVTADWDVLCDSCQFVVKDSGDYTLQATDPDALVDWDLVEQVVGCADLFGEV